MDPMYIPLITVAITALLLVYVYRFIFSKKLGSEKLADIGGRIQKGASAYLSSQMKVIVPFVTILALLIFFTMSLRVAISFIIGAIFSLFSAYAVMQLVVRVHPRVAWDAFQPLAS